MNEVEQEEIQQIDIELFDKQMDFISRTEHEVLFEGGIGSGKTKVGGLWLAKVVQDYPGSRWIMAARDHKQLINATDKEFQVVLKEWLGFKEGIHYTRKESPKLTYMFNNGTEIDGFGAHNYDSVFRGGNYDGAWGDEVDFWKKEAYEAFKGRIRVGPELIRLTSSPKGFNFIHEDYHVNKIGPVIQATTFDNPVLSDRFMESLRKTYSPKLYRQEVLAERLNLTAGAVYEEFERDKIVRSCNQLLRDDDQLYFFTDYNIGNYCGVYMFHRDGVTYVIGEEHLKHQGTQVMAPKVRARFQNRVVIVVGDSTGNNKRDVAITRTNYQIFKDCGLETKHFRNPPIMSRIINANSRFFHKKVIIDPSCPTLIRDLELLPWAESRNEPDKSDNSLSHASDAFGYGLWYFQPLLAPKKATAQLLPR